MHPKLARVFDDAEAQRKAILHQIEVISADTFHRRENNRWSLGEVLAHLITAERLSLEYMRKKSLGLQSLKPSSFSADLRFLALKISQRLPFKYKAPQHVRDHTPSDLSFEELRRQWDEQREALRQFLDSLGDSGWKKEVYKHFVAGRLNALHAVQFFMEHIHHHKPQIHRLLNKK